MFGYWIVRKGDWFKYQNAFHNIGTLNRWLSGFEDLDLLWNWIRDPECSVDELRIRYAKKRQATVYGQLCAERQANQLRADLLKAQESVRYALATFRALDRYTFEDSDHALLIAEAVSKLEDADFAATSSTRESADSTQT